ncbi:MAG: hypothetical protein Q8L68_04430 [Methylococcales bacterium]|nr:hypothetical protein [Methylococcales bacterium]
MLEIFKILRDTPIPIVLVIGGLIFLLVPFIRRVSDKVEVETTNKGLAGFIGFSLLVMGIGLYVIPSLAVTPSTPPTAIPQSIISATETPRVNPTSQAVQPVATSTKAPIKYDGWVMCWHGRDGYEYLIAYPESDVKQGVNLNFNLTNAQGRNIEVANDSLKMCYVNGEWYGYPDPNPWFPAVSHFKLLDREILVCSNSPGCQGNQSTMLPEKYYPWNCPELQAPKETGIHIVAYKSSQ